MQVTSVTCDGISRVNALKVDVGVDSKLRSNGTHCTTHNSCTECTAAAPTCYWSFVKQTCRETTTDTQRLTKWANSTLAVYDTGSCPSFSVAYTRSATPTSMNHTIRVNVTNDPSGTFAGRLGSSKIACQLEGIRMPGVMADGQIVCEAAESARPEDASAAPVDTSKSIKYFWVTMDGVPLQFDDSYDHYVSGYDSSCRDKHEADKECASCFWDDDRYRYFCRWCTRDNKCTGGQYQYCDVRNLTDFTYVDVTENVRVRCPEVRINSIQPEYGPWTGGTTVRIAVRNHRIVSENRMIVVTVAGSRCLLPTASKDDVISCTISPTNTSNLNDGPVEVVYVPKDGAGGGLMAQSITLQSDQSFYFVDPQITSVRPSCGPTAGGTEISIRGNFLNAGNAVQVFTRENISCAVITRGPNEVTCSTGGSDQPAVGPLRLEFDTYLSKYVQEPLFEYAGNPTVDDGQTFEGISSGGTRLLVRGRYFSCISNPLIFVTYNGISHTAGCRVCNDTYMECTTPKINRPVPRDVTALDFGFQADFGQTIATMRPPITSDWAGRYQLYPDPVYTDFETDGDRTVIINGLGLNQGYGLPEDLSVRLQNSTVQCNVTSVGPRNVVCQMPSSSPGDHLSMVKDGIVVTVGDSLVYDVKRKPVQLYRGRLRLTMFLSGITLVSLIVTLVVAIVYCVKIAMTTSSEQTEMQSLCDQVHCAKSTSEIAAVAIADRNQEEEKKL